LALAGCVSPTQSLMARLGEAVLNQDDPATVQQGAPAYLLLIDGLIADDPANVNLLLSGARLYSAYAGAFADGSEAITAASLPHGPRLHPEVEARGADEAGRAQRLTARARGYAERAMCANSEAACALPKLSYDELTRRLPEFSKDHAELLYVYAVAWAGWIQVRAGDWNAIAELPKLKATLERVVALDPAHDKGGAQLYMGVLESLLPAAAGGRPDVARGYYERALEMSGGRNLMVKVLYAERYARPQFDRELHDRLLKEVMAADAYVPDLTLTNTLAKRRAAQLLASADQYF
jgi:hypothetical protein